MYELIKRCIDVVLSLFAIIILAPFLIVIIIILVCINEHKVFYFQNRIGHKNRSFNLVKFVTMRSNSLKTGPGFITLPKDERVFLFGMFLRKYKINELPQLYNVIRGQMSIVGPRPLVQDTFMTYSIEVRAEIYNSKPGLTGLGSLIFRNEEVLFHNPEVSPIEIYKNDIAPFKGRLELWYNAHKDLKVDFILIWYTILSIYKFNDRVIYSTFKDLPQPNGSYFSAILFES